MFLEFRRIVVSGVQEDKRKVNHYLSLKGGTVSSLQHRSILHYWSMVKVVLYGKQNGDHGLQVLRRDFLQVFYCESNLLQRFHRLTHQNVAFSRLQYIEELLIETEV